MERGDYYIIPSTYERGKLGQFFISVYVDNENAEVDNSEVIAEEEEIVFEDGEEKKKSIYILFLDEGVMFNKKAYEIAKESILELFHEKSIIFIIII